MDKEENILYVVNGKGIVLKGLVAELEYLKKALPKNLLIKDWVEDELGFNSSGYCTIGLPIFSQGLKNLSWNSLDCAIHDHPIWDYYIEKAVIETIEELTIEHFQVVYDSRKTRIRGRTR